MELRRGLLKNCLGLLLFSLVLSGILTTVAFCESSDSYKISVLSKESPKEINVYYHEGDPLILAIDEKLFPDYTINKDEHFNIKLGIEGIEVYTVNGSGRALMKKATNADSTVSFLSESKKMTYNKYTVEVNNSIKKDYEGVLQIKRDANKLFIILVRKKESVIADLVTEHAGVYSSKEALKAQAVIERTILYMKSKTHELGGYDLCDTEHCIDCAFCNDGRTKASKESLTAAKETDGEIITYDDDPIYPYYCEICGGYTTSASVGFGLNDSIFPYIKSVKCDYCKDYKGYKFKKTLKKSLLSGIFLGKDDKKFDINVVKYDRNKHYVKTVQITAESYNYTVSGSKFMRLISGALGANGIPSGSFKAKKERDAFVFTGSGIGDDVGLCQAGADKMAKSGKSYKDIIKYYYSGVKISKL